MKFLIRAIVPLIALAGTACSSLPIEQNSPRVVRTQEKKGMPLSFTKPLSPPLIPAPTPAAAAIAVIDPKTGKLLYGYRAHERRQVASTQKIVTALCVLDAGNLNRMATVTQADLKTPRIRMDLHAGESYTRGDLLRALLTASYNDVAVTLARDTAGSVEAFVQRMNARAQRMGMKNTHFSNPHGLPGKQYSTAYDMALAACWAYNSPFIRSTTDVAEYQFLLENGQTKRVKNTNKLLPKHYWVNGMKTGYTNAAGRCLISSGSLNGESVIVVVLGSTPSKIWGESLKYLKWALKIQ